MHGASPALACITAHVGACQTKFFAQHLNKAILMAPCAKPQVMDYEKIFDLGYKTVFQAT